MEYDILSKSVVIFISCLAKDTSNLFIGSLDLKEIPENDSLSTQIEATFESMVIAIHVKVEIILELIF